MNQRKIILTSIITMVIITIIDSSINISYTNAVGAAAGYTGSTVENSGRSCAFTSPCHGGTANSQPLISTNIDPNGYVPDSTYSISITVNQLGVSKFGFQSSPQDGNGDLIGTVILDNQAETQLLMSGKYITHTASGTSGIDSRSWTYSWTAPPTGLGPVTFYAAANATNGDSTSSGDVIYTHSMLIQEEGFNSVFETLSNVNNVQVFVDFASSILIFGLEGSMQRFDNIEIYSIAGALVTRVTNIHESEVWIDVSSLSKGMYIYRTQELGGQIATGKFFRP